MHPVVLRLPFPDRTLPLLGTLLAVAGVLALYAAWIAWRQGRKAAVGTALFAMAVAAFGVMKRGETFHLEPFPIYSYGVMLGLSFVVGWYLTLGMAERDGLPKELMATNFVVTAVSAIVGSRVLYIVTNLQEFQTFQSLFEMRKGGLVAYGGFLGGFFGSIGYLRSQKIPLLPWADVVVPSLASGLMITRIGCYLFGCDFGQPLKDTAPGWLKTLGTFPHWKEGAMEGAPAWIQHVKQRGLSPEAAHSLPVHPTQLYESLVGASLLVMLLFARRKQSFRGQLFFTFTFAYGFLRFLLEILRDDAERGDVPPSMPAHWLIPLSLVVFAFSFGLGPSRFFPKSLRTVAVTVMSCVPVAAFVWLRPGAFELAPPIALSTSQAVGLATALAASIAYYIFDGMAKEHPESAMALGLPELAPATPEGSSPTEVGHDPS